MKCPKCGVPVSEADYFCPQCGAKLKDRPLPTTVGRQILVYLMCLFLPPFGLWPAVRYLKQGDEKSKVIGIIAVVLTALSLAVTVYLTINFINSTAQSLSNLNTLGL